MRIIALVTLLAFTSCTTAGRIHTAIGVTSVTTGVTLMARDDGQSGGGMLLVDVGIVALIVALCAEVSHAGEHPPATGPVASTGTGGGIDWGSRVSPDSTSESASAATPRTSGPVVPSAVGVNCSFGDCTKNGSSGRAADGTSVDTRCSFGDCSKNGWSTTNGNGTSSDTRCSFGDCSTNGWSTANSNGTSSDTRCSFGNCNTNGWTTTNSDGSSSDTRCSFGDCNANGWTTTDSSGHSVTCRCRFGDCNANGVDCD